jgi:D-alanyl-lipoteichoic acid acyltransferase DltB (MBOAT superfamily)
MLFNSIDFAIFLPVVFLIYWFALGGKRKSQNYLLLLASYVFYGWWDWRFLGLMLFSTIVDYSLGLQIHRTTDDKCRKIFLVTSLSVNLGLLGFFKYYNFFVENFIEAFSLLGTQFSIHTLSIILPVGISFYTFQTLSYTLDVYNRKLIPTRSFIDFAAFVSFFPQLVAGPIERASNLLPQFVSERKFDANLAINGLRQILWGLVKKMLIADNCAQFSNQIFETYDTQPSHILFLGAFFFALQIYGDFSGYSDIAIGVSRLFGFRLMQNFSFPYFSRDMAEFWRRWHISLSTWFRDYLYIPLGGSKGGKYMQLRNTLIIFVVSGFWHGANWTFICWGLLNALYFFPLLLSGKNRANLEIVAAGKLFPTIRELWGMASTFVFTMVAWILFRADSMQQATSYIYRMVTGIFDFEQIGLTKSFLAQEVGIWLVLVIVGFTAIEWLGREGQFGLDVLPDKLPKPLRWALYVCLVLLIFALGGSQQEFIYFQF